MRRLFWTIPVVLLVAALGSTSAHADGIAITNAGGYVTAVDGITLNGALYNVTFSSTVDNTFSAYLYYSATIAGVINSIDADLGSTFIEASDGTIIDVYGVAAAGGFQELAFDNDPWVNYGYTSTVGSGYNYFANFTPAATPEPGTVTLTLIGIGLLGLMVVMRKRVAHRRPRAT